MFASALFAVVGLSSCEEEELAYAEVTVLQEVTASQGQVHQLEPLEGVEVTFHVPEEGAEHLEAIDITDSQGKVNFVYKYESRVWAKVSYMGGNYEKLLYLQTGETVYDEIIIPE